MLIRRLTPLLVTVAVATALVPSAASAEDGFPDRGRFAFAPMTGGPFAGTVHAVQAGPEATIVYLSVGFTPKRDGSVGGASGFLGFGASSSDEATAASDSSLRMLRVIDPAGGKVYRPLQSSASPECICTPMSSVPKFDPKTQLVTFAAVLPPLPAKTQTVDVDVTGQGLIVPNVDVTRGEALTPVSGDGTAIVMGEGWPRLDLDDARTVKDTAPFIADLVATTEDLDRTQRVEKSPTTTEVSVAADVLFAVDKADLSPKAQTQLARVAKDLGRASGPVTVTGHTDSDGSDAANLDLSKRRAASVVAALQQLSAGTKFTAEGKGEAEPAAPNTSAEGKQLNRRVTISFPTKEGQ